MVVFNVEFNISGSHITRLPQLIACLKRAGSSQLQIQSSSRIIEFKAAVLALMSIEAVGPGEMKCSLACCGTLRYTAVHLLAAVHIDTFK